MSNMIRSTIEGVMLEVADRFSGVLTENKINVDLHYCPQSLALRRRAAAQDTLLAQDPDKKMEPVDKYKLEFISVWLSDLSFSWKRQRTAVARDGIATKLVNSPTMDANAAVETFQAMPIDMNFEITFWTKKKESMDEFLQDFIFWQQDNPFIHLFYNIDKPLDLPVLIGSITPDDTKIERMFVEGKYWKHSFKFMVESWVFRGVEVYTVKKILIDLYVTQDYVAADSILVFSEEIDGEVDYDASVLPQKADPVWGRSSNGAPLIEDIESGVLHLKVDHAVGYTNYYTQNDLKAAIQYVIKTRIKVPNVNTPTPYGAIALQIVDDTYQWRADFVPTGISIGGTAEYVTSVAVDMTQYHDITLVVLNGIINIYVDGVMKSAVNVRQFVKDPTMQPQVGFGSYLKLVGAAPGTYQSEMYLEYLKYDV